MFLLEREPQFQYDRWLIITIKIYLNSLRSLNPRDGKSQITYILTQLWDSEVGQEAV